MRQLTKVFRNARSWHGSQLFIEEEDRVCFGLRLGLRKRRNGGLDCCCHINSSLLPGVSQNGPASTLQKWHSMEGNSRVKHPRSYCGGRDPQNLCSSSE